MTCQILETVNIYGRNKGYVLLDFKCMFYGASWMATEILIHQSLPYIFHIFETRILQKTTEQKFMWNLTSRKKRFFSEINFVITIISKDSIKPSKDKGRDYHWIPGLGWIMYNFF